MKLLFFDKPKRKEKEKFIQLFGCIVINVNNYSLSKRQY